LDQKNGSSLEMGRKMTMKKLLAATTALAIMIGGATTAHAASTTASGALFGVLADPGNTGSPDAKLSFEDNNWSFDPSGTPGSAAALLAAIGPFTPATAFFNISSVGGSNTTVLDPAADIAFGSETAGSNWGIFGSIFATGATSTVNGAGAITSISLSGITAEMRFIDGTAAPLIDGSTATATAFSDFTTLGSSAATFADTGGSAAFYTLFVDSTVASPTFGKITGFELGLMLTGQTAGPKFLPGVLSDGTVVDLYGTGTLIYNIAGVASTTGSAGDFIVGDADFALNAIPTPAAVVPSLGMMALVAFRRRRKKAA
jgi:hypothetical protein